MNTLSYSRPNLNQGLRQQLRPLRYWLYGVLGGLVLNYGSAHAQPAHSPRPVAVEGRLDYDTFFGFYPSVSVSRALDSLRTLTGYTVLYTDPAFFGVETGLTVSLSTRRKHWTLVPGAGLLSGSVFVPGRRFKVGEGGYGSLGIQYEQSGWFGQGYGAYWRVWQRKTADAYDFAFYFVQAGRVLSPKLRLGLVWGRLANVRLARNRGDTSQFDVYRFALAATVLVPLGLTVQLAGGRSWGTNAGGFYQFGLSRFFTRRFTP